MSHTIITKGFTVGLAMLAATTLGACKGKDQYAANDSAKAANDSAAGRVDTTRRDTVAAAPATANNTSGGWTPVSILSYVITSDNGEIREGTLVEKKATNAQVKAFGRQMVSDHRAALSEMKSLASKMNVTVDTTTDAAKDMANQNRDDLKDLNDTKAGADWDKKFLDKAIDDHQHVLDKLQDASKNTTDAQLTAALTKASGKVQEHLTKAQNLRAKMQ
jgi:putative membrane protein